MLRKPIILMFTLVSVLAALAMTTAASASAAQRIDMKVLLLGTSTTEPDFVSWQDALQREGVPFETIITSTGHTPITAATLSDTLANGTPEAKYQGSSSRSATCPNAPRNLRIDALTGRMGGLEEYEQTFNVRQLTGDVFPSATYGLNSPTTSGALEGDTGDAHDRRQNGLSLPEGRVAMDTGTYGYEATPLTTQATGSELPHARLRHRPARRSWVSTRIPTASRKWSRPSTRTRTSCRPSFCATAR
jgi:hypothetical protein